MAAEDKYKHPLPNDIGELPDMAYFENDEIHIRSAYCQHESTYIKINGRWCSINYLSDDNRNVKRLDKFYQEQKLAEMIEEELHDQAFDI